MTQRSSVFFGCLGVIGLLATFGPLRAAEPPATEVLYNGIRLPAEWPPRLGKLSRKPLTPPYLQDPPQVIPIDVGRQLFVDDFLIDSTSLRRTFHRAEYWPDNPVLRPEESWETKTTPNPCAMPFSDGLFWDPKDRRFKLWYMGGYVASTCYATSEDGIRWERPELDVVKGTNIVSPSRRDSSTIWLDLMTENPRERYKMALSTGSSFLASVSEDGIHWSKPETSGPMGDRSTFFYNPFRKVWVYSLRASSGGDPRVRRYREGKDFLAGMHWKSVDEPVLWVGSDDLDPPREDLKTVCQLYNLDCVAYESVILGLFTIWRGQPGDRAKPNEVCLGFSRDGFHWSRPDRRAFLPVSERQGDWNWGNVQSVGGGCLVMGDQLRFYVSGRAGVPGRRDSGICSMGFGTLRRDGFASMDADADGGTLTTRPVQFRGKHLFVNVAAPDGEVRAEVLNKDGQPIAPFTLENCEPIHGDSTRQRIRWKQGDDLSKLAGETVRLRFSVRNGSLYSFWISPDVSGASHGYMAAGGPEFTSAIDDVGATRAPAK